jgi:hypothetical protein
MQPGPSEVYLRMLRGEISARKYANRLKKNVDRQIGKQGGTVGQKREASA